MDYSKLLQELHLITRLPRRAPNHVNTSHFTNTTPPPSEWKISQP